MPKLTPVKSKELVKILLRLGFIERDAEWSHVFFKHADGRTTVIPLRNREISKGLLKKIHNDVKLSVEEYEQLRK